MGRTLARAHTCRFRALAAPCFILRTALTYDLRNRFFYFAHQKTTNTYAPASMRCIATLCRWAQGMVGKCGKSRRGTEVKCTGAPLGTRLPLAGFARSVVWLKKKNTGSISGMSHLNSRRVFNLKRWHQDPTYSERYECHLPFRSFLECLLLSTAWAARQSTRLLCAFTRRPSPLGGSCISSAHVLRVGPLEGLFEQPHPQDCLVIAAAQIIDARR